MMMRLLITSLLLILSNNIISQTCYSGTLLVSGPGCGCLSGCDLTTFGGPNCGTGVTGDCNSGYQLMSIDIVVTTGCTLTVDATMRPRPGCSSSGADGNSQTTDRLKVDIISGSKPFQFGPSNSTINDSYTLVGPGVVRISGAGNRADEIITYNVTYSDCNSCIIALPIELTSFIGNYNDVTGYDELKWSTASEINNDRFELYSSINGTDWELIGSVNGAGNSTTQQHYIYNYRSNSQLTYYKLKQVDYDGEYKYSDIISVYKDNKMISVKYFDILGKELPSEPENGLFIKMVQYEYQVEYKKIFKQ